MQVYDWTSDKKQGNYKFIQKEELENKEVVELEQNKLIMIKRKNNRKENVSS